MKPVSHPRSVSEKLFAGVLLFTALVILVVGWVFIIFFQKNKNG